MKHFVIGSLALVCTGCTSHLQTLPDQSAPIRAEVISISPEMRPRNASLTGVVTARTAADLSSQIMAQVSELRVKEGDRVGKGQVLVRLSSAPLAAGVQQADAQAGAARKQEASARAQHDLAAATFARYDLLNQRHSVTPHEFDQVKAQLEAAGAQQQAAAAQVQAAEAASRGSRATEAYTVIRAPFSGIITAKYAQLGTTASPGVPLLRMEGVADREVDLQVNESALRTLRLGDFVQATLQGSDTAIAGRVREIVPAGDPAAHTFTVKVALPLTASTYSGMTADVAIPMGQQTALVIPANSIQQRGQLDSVLALDESSIAQTRYVKLGHTTSNRVEIISGLNAGDRILAQPRETLVGHKIEPQP